MTFSPFGFSVRCSVVLLLVSSVMLAGCGGGDSQPSAEEADQHSSDSAQMDPSARADRKEPVEGLCIYQGAPVRTAPGTDATYLTSLNVGESIVFLNKTETAKGGDQTKEYSKIRLKGGENGWVRSDMIATEAEPAAFLREAILHERPTPVASTEKTFRAMDVVAVLDTQDTWVKVRGVRRGEDWWDTGWVKPEALTYTQTDVAVAGLWKKAREKQDSTERRAALKRIVDNPSLKESVFVDSLTARLDASGAS